MKKCLPLIIFTALFSLSVPLFSQVKLPFKLGLQLSPNIGWMNPATKGYSNNGANLGATMGLVGDFYFAENYAFSTGINFQFLNGKLNYADSVTGTVSKKLENGEVFRKYQFLYLEIPLMIKMKTKTFGKVSYYGQIGLGTAFRLKATVKEHFVPDNGLTEDNSLDFDQGTTLVRESIKIGGGCEYHLDESTRIMVGLSYSNSLNNVLTGSNRKSYLNEKSMLNYAELSIGILF